VTKVALITGASRGIGAATARLAAKAGYAVCVNYTRDSQSAEAVVAECQQYGVPSIAVAADVSDANQVAKLFSECDARLGPVSLLVNNAGIIGSATRLEALSQEVLQRTFEVNVYGSIYCAQQAISRMSTRQGGQGGVIINLSSVAADLGSPGEYVHYAASKGAIESLTRGLAKELGPEGIRVNALQAGTTETDIHTTGGNPDRPAQVAAASPLGRVGQPEDMAEAILWLASAGASYANGSILRLAGGL